MFSAYRQYSLMPSQKVSSEVVLFEPRGGRVENVMLLEARGVLGKALTTTEVMMP